MVKITNGVRMMEVPAGAFSGIFAKQGYRLVEDYKEVRSESTSAAEAPVDPETKFVEDLKEKPISQWTKDEVRRYAAAVGIDISGTKNPGEAKQLIKAHLEAGK